MRAGRILIISVSFQAVWVFSLIDYEPPTYHNGDYVYPWWAEAIGWGIASLSLICIPAFAVCVLVRADGITFAEVRQVLLTLAQPQIGSLIYQLAHPPLPLSNI